MPSMITVRKNIRMSLKTHLEGDHDQTFAGNRKDPSDDLMTKMHDKIHETKTKQEHTHPNGTWL